MKEKQPMQSYQEAFIDLAIECEALCFGSFELKSGRTSPYFFNAGRFNRGADLARLGRCYAAAIEASGVDFDLLFGPAYKGIPLVSATAMALYDSFSRNYPYAFNRKESKSHGEGGTIVGSELSGRVMIIDDVITAGTAIREVLEIIHSAAASAAGVVIGLDRQERGQGDRSAIQEIEQDLEIPVVSIVQLEQIVQYLKGRGESEQVANIEEYRRRYGVN